MQELLGIYVRLSTSPVARKSREHRVSGIIRNYIYLADIEIQHSVAQAFQYFSIVTLMELMEEDKVLVTGGSGLVGNGVRLALQSYNNVDKISFIFLSSKDGDLKDILQVEAIFKKYKPKYVLHLAAAVGGLYKNMREKVQFFEDNVTMDINIFRCCRKFSVEKVVSCLSTCIFPDKTKYPIDESMLHDGPPHQSNEGYAYAKRMVDVLSRAYRDQYGLNAVTVIPTNVYGPFDNFNLEAGHVAPSLIHKCYVAKRDDTHFTIRGSGNPLRQFIYSVDLGRLLIWVLLNYNEPEPIILSVPEKNEISIAKLSEIISKALHFTGDIKCDTQYADGQYKKTACPDKLLGLLDGSFEFTPIDLGIKETVEWFCEHFENCRK